MCLFCHRVPPPVRSRPANKRTETAPTKPPPSRGGKPPSGAGGAAAKKTESRFYKAGSKEDKNNQSSKSAPPQKKEAKQEDKDEKIVEEEKEERRFDPSGYEKDLVDMLGNNRSLISVGALLFLCGVVCHFQSVISSKKTPTSIGTT